MIQAGSDPPAETTHEIINGAKTAFRQASDAY